MPLEEAVIDVPLLPMNQQAPKTQGPVGRIKRVVNGVIKKVLRSERGQVCRVEKRDGFTQFPATVRDPTTGATSSKAMASPSLLSTLGERLVAVASSSAFILSETSSCFESPSYHCPTQVLRERPVSLNNGIPVEIDSARVGARTMFLIMDSTSQPLLRVIDDDGTLIREFSLVGGGIGVVKLASDGTRFWAIALASGGGGQYQAFVFDTNGVQLATASIASNGTIYYDITRFSSTAIVQAHKDPVAGTIFTVWTWTGVGISTGTTIVPGVLNNGRQMFLTNDSGDGNFYITTISGGGPYNYFVYQMSSVFVILHTYNVAAGKANLAFEMTGFVAPTGAKDVTLVLSTLDGTPDTRLNYSEIYTITFAGVSTLARTQRSLTVASRPFNFAINGTYYAVFYYQSLTTVGETQQSTFFLVNLASPWQVCGRWEFGTAYADWHSSAGASHHLHLSSPTTGTDNSIHVALAYRARSFVTRVITGNQAGTATEGIGRWSDQFANTVGVRDFIFGPDHGQAVEYAGELLIPGPQATQLAGNTFVEDGVPLVPEITSIAQSAGGSLNLTTAYEYVAVAEWTDENGNRVRSPASSPKSFTLTGANNRLTVTGLQIHVSNKFNLTVALYRTVFQNGQQSTIHKKVTNDLSPTYIDDSIATWSIVDGVSDAVAATGETLYTDKLLLDQFPAPPFSVGCYSGGRAYLVGYDNAIWFSGEKTEGDALWFSPFFRILVPTTQKITQVRPVDNYLLVFTERSQVFAVPIAALPDATGSGGILTPTLLPFTDGCTGHALTTEVGVFYSSAQGEIALIDRGLQRHDIGRDVQDDTSGATIRGIAVDKYQRVHVLTSNGALLIYDLNVNVWTIDSPSVSPSLIAPHKGQLAYVASNGTCWRRVAGQFSDITAAGSQTSIVTTLTIASIHFGSVRGFRRIWGLQVIGEYIGAHIMNATVTFDDEGGAADETYIWTPSAGVPYHYELPPKVELCSAVEITFSESFPFGPSGGYALELLSFRVGLERGQNRIPPSRRIAPT